MIRGLATITLLLAAAAPAVEPPDRSGGDPRAPADVLGGGPPGAVHAVAAASALGPLPFFYDLYTFRGREGGTAVVAAFAVSAGELRKEEVEDRVRYRFDVSFVLSDTARHTITRTDDSVFVSREGSLDRDHLLHTYVQVETPPTTTSLQRVIMTDATTPGVGQLYQSPFPVPDYGGDHLMLSDVALGLPGATRGWERGGATLALLPTSQFPQSAFDVYYEIYNLPSGASYETELSIEPLTAPDAGDDDAAGRAVRTLFSGRSDDRTDGTVAELRRVESALPRGRYRLTVTVRDTSSGETASQERTFEVRGWSQGATLVPALPRRDRTGWRG